MGWLENLVDMTVRKTINKTIKDSIKRAVDEVLTPEYVHNVLRGLFKGCPNKQLTRVGFEMAMGLSLQDIWPNMTFQECIRVMREELRTAGIEYGDKDYLWTAAAAKELSVEYGKTYGESVGA